MFKPFFRSVTRRWQFAGREFSSLTLLVKVPDASRRGAMIVEVVRSEEFESPTKEL
jgi:hypothetical protein